MQKLIQNLAVVGTILVLILSACSMPGLSTPTPLATFLAPSDTALPTEVVGATEQLVPSATVAPSTLIPTMPLPTETVAMLLPLVTDPGLVYMDMIDADVGWGWTEQSVLHTLDGGQTWENITPGGGFPTSGNLSGAFLDAKNGWVLSPATDYLSGTLYRTQDAGRTWQAATVPFAGAFFDFLDTH